METENSTSFSFHVKKRAVIDQKYFVYHHKQYPVDFYMLKVNSTYFLKNQAQFENTQYIDLLDEKEEHIKLSDESIEAFVSSCQNEPCTINQSSVIPLQYLANKFEFQELIEITDNFISQHSSELAFPILLFKSSENDENFQKNEFYDTTKEENLISDRLTDFIKEEEMMALPIPVLYRILKRFYSNEKKSPEITSDMTNFLFKCLNKYGRSASVLFNIVDFKEEKIEVVDRLIQDYSKVFDFNMINLTLTKTTKELTSELSKQKEEHSKSFSQMKQTFEEQRSELIQMKKEEKEQYLALLSQMKQAFEEQRSEMIQIQNELKNQEMMKNFLDEMNKIKDEVDKKLQKMESKFGEICKKQEEIIDKGIVNKYHRIILNTITLGQFIKFDDNLKEHFIMEALKNTTNQNNQKNVNQAILNFKHIDLDSLSKDKNLPMIQFIKDVAGNLKITNNIIENLYENGLLSSSLNDNLNNFDSISIELNYPSKNFQEIMRDIFDIKNDKNSNKMIISLTINQKEYFDQKYQWNKIISKCIVSGDIKSISKSSFSDFSNLSEIQLSNGITKIEDFSFESCSLLKQVSIPTSVTSIGNGSFEGCSSLQQISIPTSVTQIGENCFNECSKLEQVTIDPFCTQFDGISFNNCPSLNNFKFPSENQASNSSRRAFIPYFMTENFYGKNLFNSSQFTSRIENISEIEIEIKYPSDHFSDIFEKVKNIKHSYASKVKIVIFYSGMKTTDRHFYRNQEINGVRFDKTVKKTPGDGNDTSNGAFENCYSIEKVIIHSSFTKFGNYAFCNCYPLKQISFVNPSSLREIGMHAFHGCRSLTQITIPPSVTSIGEYAFHGCESLSQITIPPSVTSIGKNAFSCCNSLSRVTIPSRIDTSNLGFSTNPSINRV